MNRETRSLRDIYFLIAIGCAAIIAVGCDDAMMNDGVNDTFVAPSAEVDQTYQPNDSANAPATAPMDATSPMDRNAPLDQTAPIEPTGPTDYSVEPLGNTDTPEMDLDLDADTDANDDDVVEEVQP